MMESQHGRPDYLTTAEIVNLPESLAQQIGRVTALREQYKSLRNMSGVNPEPAIMMMTREIDAAIKAQGGGDIEQMFICCQALEGYKE